MISSKYIKATNEFSTYENNVPAPYIRKTFDLEVIPECANITVSCTGYYRLWINGTEITDSILAPYFSNPDEIIFYDTYDVQNFLIKGKNCIALILGNGMSNMVGGYVWEFDKAAFRSAPKLALSFEAKTNGTTLTFEADDSFKCTPSPVFFNDLHCGEFYDARNEITGWNMPEFDDSNWNNAICTDSPRGKALYNDTDKVVITKELKPIKIYNGFCNLEDVLKRQKETEGVPYEDNTGHDFFYKAPLKETGTVFEFEKNTSCLPKLRIKGKKGQRIVIQASEFCQNGEISYENIHMYSAPGFCQRIIYICKGEGVEEFVPSFTYIGAKYLFVTGLEKDQISEDTITMLVINSDIKERGGFVCSDAVANALQNCVRNSDLGNFVHIPTDCPHREKNGWTGDVALSTEHMMQNLAVERNLRQWLKMMCLSQREDGAFPAIIPSTGWGYAWGDGHGPWFDSVLIEVPYQAYIYRGDKTIFEECAPSLVKYLHFIQNHIRSDGLIKIGLGDFRHAMRTDPHNHTCPTEVSDTIICYGICKKCEFMFYACEDEQNAALARSLAKKLLTNIRSGIIDYNTMTVLGSCQAAQALALYYGIFNKDEESAAYAKLVELIHKSDYHIDCGVLGTRVMFRVLGEHGDGELAYKMITRTDAPSYGILVTDFGLTTLPEQLFGAVDGATISLNHHFLGDISGFFISHIAGLQINPNKNNPSEVRICPTFITSLTHAEAYYDTVSGRIKVKWQRKGELIELMIDCNDGITGNIVLPKGYKFASGETACILNSSTYIICKN